MSTLERRLAVAKYFISQQSSQTISEVYLVLSSMQSAFPDLFILVCVALTIPISSASAEDSFSALKHIKSHLQLTM